MARSQCLGLFEDRERSREGDAHPAPEQSKLRLGPVAVGHIERRTPDELLEDGVQRHLLAISHSIAGAGRSSVAWTEDWDRPD